MHIYVVGAHSTCIRSCKVRVRVLTACVCVCCHCLQAVLKQALDTDPSKRSTMTDMVTVLRDIVAEMEAL